jgi:hypothetical protein
MTFVGGDCTQNPCRRVDECNGDLSPTKRIIASQTNSQTFVVHPTLSMKYEEDERVRQLCKNAFSADSDEAFQVALQELRDEISGSMVRARERLTDLAIIDGHSKAAD